jgi:hypothetical protein
MRENDDYLGCNQDNDPEDEFDRDWREEKDSGYCTDPDCELCNQPFLEEPDIDESQEWADLPYGYDDDAGYRDEDRWYNGEYDS